MGSPVVLGSSKIAKIKTHTDLTNLLKDYITSDFVIVKPNFVDRAPGTHTDLESLQMLLQSIDSKIIVIEGHQLIRCLSENESGISFEHEGKTCDWWWIARGGWNYFADHDDWSWFKDSHHWERLKELDHGFLEEKGFIDLFNEYDVEYINVTDEIWSGNVVTVDQVRFMVEERYGALSEPKVYGFMPKKLYKYRGSDLINFSKFKQYATFTLKNMFGLLPDPIRCWWHGPENRRLNQSIVDINKLYSTLFNIIGVHESLGKTPIVDPNGSISIPGVRYNLHEGIGLVGVGTDRVELDSIMCGVGKYQFKDADYLKEADGVLGCFREEIYDKARSMDLIPKMASG